MPIRAPFRIATMVMDRVRSILVRITTHEGLAGWGEACPFRTVTGETQGICAAAARDLAPELLGKNPVEADALSRFMERYLPHNTTTRCAFDMAIHDIAAQAAHLPLYRYFLGDKRRLEIDVTITHPDPSAAAELAMRAVSEGYGVLKVKIGWDPTEDYVRLAKISMAVGPGVPLRLDANQGYADADAALEALRRFAEFNVEFCEQPVPAQDIKGMKRVTEFSPIRIMADESLFTPREAERLAEEKACDYFNVKLSKAGGLEAVATIARIATAADIPCMMGGSLETRLGLTASAHLASAFPIFKFLDLDGSYDHARDDVIGGIRIKPPQIILPESPGLGAAYPDEETTDMRKIVDLH